jgi:rare lipoprotein A
VLPRLSRLFWILLLACAFVAFDGEHAEAREGLASWYGPGFKGLPTASGEVYDPSGYTAAHKKLPLGTELMVSYRGRSVQVTVNDRGPYIRGRELDLSRGAARTLGLVRSGVDHVEYTRTNPRAGNQTGYASYPESPRSTPGSEIAPASQAAAGGAASGGGAYVVQPGDTLSGVAAELGTSVEYLASSNGIANPDLIYSGQTIYF